MIIHDMLGQSNPTIINQEGFWTSLSHLLVLFDVLYRSQSIAQHRSTKVPIQAESGLSGIPIVDRWIGSKKSSWMVFSPHFCLASTRISGHWFCHNYEYMYVCICNIYIYICLSIYSFIYLSMHTYNYNIHISSMIYPWITPNNTFWNMSVVQSSICWCISHWEKYNNHHLKGRKKITIEYVYGWKTHKIIFCMVKYGNMSLLHGKPLQKSDRRMRKSQTLVHIMLVFYRRYIIVNYIMFYGGFHKWGYPSSLDGFC